MRTRLKQIVYWCPALSWALLIFMLSHQTGSNLPSLEIPGADKFVHFALYIILCLLLYLGFRRERNYTPARAVLYAFFVAAIYGAIDEIHQHYVPERVTSVVDWMADVAGVGTASLALWIKSLRGRA